MFTCEESDNCLIIRLFNDKPESDLIKSPLNESIGQITGYIYKKIAIITSLYVDKLHRKQGLGIKLMNKFLKKVFELGAVHAQLDDCSDNCCKNHNIYIKCGFKYVDYYDNLMAANIRTALAHITIELNGN